MERQKQKSGYVEMFTLIEILFFVHHKNKYKQNAQLVSIYNNFQWKSLNVYLGSEGGVVYQPQKYLRKSRRLFSRTCGRRVSLQLAVLSLFA